MKALCTLKDFAANKMGIYDPEKSSLPNKHGLTKNKEFKWVLLKHWYDFCLYIREIEF